MPDIPAPTTSTLKCSIEKDLSASVLSEGRQATRLVVKRAFGLGDHAPGLVQVVLVDHQARGDRRSPERARAGVEYGGLDPRVLQDGAQEGQPDRIGCAAHLDHDLNLSVRRVERNWRASRRL